jgi:hypothetical protein
LTQTTLKNDASPRLRDGRFLRCTGALVILASLLGLGPRSLRPANWNFEFDAPGRIADGFTNAVGQWQVVKDGDNQPIIRASEMKREVVTLRSALVACALLTGQRARAGDLAVLPDPPTPTKEFAVKGTSAYLGGKPIRLWGLRCVHALRDRALTERLVRNLDNFTEHGINLVSVFLQAAHGGYPDIQAGANPFGEFGVLDPAFAWRLEWLAREADKRGVVVLNRYAGMCSVRREFSRRNRLSRLFASWSNIGSPAMRATS